MKNLSVKHILFLMLLYSGIALPSCVTCPTGAAKFCSLCVTGPVVVGDLTVQGTFTVCSGPTGCECIYDGYLSWNDQETNYNQKSFPDGSTPFIQYGGGNNAIFSGWVIVPSFSGPNLTITAEFEVPNDLDPSVPPTVTLHWFNFPNDYDCTGNYVNWEIVANTLGNGGSFGPTPQYDVTTGDILLITTGGANFVQQQASVVLATGPGFVPGGYGQISTTRVSTATGNAEYDCDSLLSVIGLQYRKTPQ